MIGTRIWCRTQKSWWGYVCLSLAVATMAAAFLLRSREVVPIAVLPGTLGIALLLSPERRFLARFTPAALEIARPAALIPYTSLLEAHPIAPVDKPRPPAFAIWVVHTNGGVMIPATLNVASERVYAFLCAKIRENPPRPLPEALERYRREQEQTFGPSRIFSCTGRRTPPQVRRVQPSLGWALAVTGGLWMILGVARASAGDGGWAVAGGICLLVGVLMALVDWLPNARLRPPSAAAIVITPVGLALQQDTLNGHLTWQEIRKVTTRTRREAFAFQGSASPAPAVVLEVSGASIDITDAYERPLADIREQILRYWK